MQGILQLFELGRILFNPTRVLDAKGSSYHRNKQVLGLISWLGSWKMVSAGLVRLNGWGRAAGMVTVISRASLGCATLGQDLGAGTAAP